MKKENNFRNKLFKDDTILKEDVLELKAGLLCLGLKVPEKLRNFLDNYFLEPGFVHGTQIILVNSDNSKVIVNVPINERFVIRYSPFGLLRKEKGWFITKNDVPIAKCEPLLMPSWVNIPLNEMLKIGDIVRPHSDNLLFCVPVKKCVFETLNKKCKFCTFSENKLVYNFNNLDLIRKAFKIIFSKTDNYKEVAIGGATPNLGDFGASYFSKVVKIIKELQPEVKISLEIIPPSNLEKLHELFSSGVDSIIMNLEIFDDEIRRRICPGKSIVSKSHYFKAYKNALNIFGKNKVSSVLIVGLESKKSTIRGVKELLKIGVTPTLIPFKPYDSCQLNILPPTQPEYYLSIYKDVILQVKKSGVNPLEDIGCTYCGGCSMETLICKMGGSSYG
jgi:hypothetical protein